MKYVSYDCETTCIDPRRPENILGLSMVIEDSDHPEIPLLQLPHFTCMIGHERVEGTPYALAMNAWILYDIENHKKGKPTKYPVYHDLIHNTGWLAGMNGMYPAGTWLEKAMQFLDHHFGTDRINIAGKNVASFDMAFMPEMLRSRFRVRAIDAGSVGVDWNARCLPDLAELKRRAGLGGVISHDMREDALDVIAYLRTTYPKKGA